MPGHALENAIEIPQGRIDLAQGAVAFEDGQAGTLSEREVELIRYLAQHADRVVSRDEILERVWRIDPAGLVTRTIDMHIARLRQKLRDDPQAPAVLQTVRGRGYRWCCGAEEDDAPVSASQSGVSSNGQSR
jgi:DNA-binding response OmpR family regulator